MSEALPFLPNEPIAGLVEDYVPFGNGKGNYRISYSCSNESQRKVAVELYKSEHAPEYPVDPDYFNTSCDYYYEVWNHDTDELIGLLNLDISPSDPGESDGLFIRPVGVFIHNKYRGIGLGGYFAWSVGHFFCSDGLFEQELLKYKSILFYAEFMSKGGEMFSRALSEEFEDMATYHKLDYATDWGY